MQEALKKVVSGTAESVAKTVTLCIRSQKIELNGVWNWEMNSDAVYASDVMSFPDEMEATRGIIYPDDLSKLMAALSLMEEKEVSRLDFRIITTYGEVKTISGQRVSIEQPKTTNLIDLVPGIEPWQEALDQLALQKEADFLQLRKEIADHSERFYNTGSWLINKSTAETWYSDNVYRIYGLAPQSLNAHINTFNAFIHPDDRMTVLDAFEKAYEKEAALQLEYRILLPDGESKYVQQITKWIYSNKGQFIFTGILRDVTEERRIADELFAAQSTTLLNQQLLKLSEQQSLTGHWHINLVTRQASFSENYYRIYGVRQNALPNHNSFLNLVHPEDRNRVRDAIEQMYRGHVLPEIEFRIIRPEGKIKIVKQSGRLFITPTREMIMIGVVQDVTAVRGLEKKIADLNTVINLNRMVTEMTESIADVSSITWMPDGYMLWSDGFYQLLGYRPGTVEPISRILHKSIHVDDLISFKAAEALVMNGQPYDDITVRIVSKSGMRWVRFSFRQLSNEKNESITIGLAHDITRQKAVQEELTNAKSFGSLVMNAVNNIILFTNTDNVILHWNEEAVNATGILEEDALQNNLFEVLPKLNEEDFLGQLHFALRGNETQPRRIANAYIRKVHDYRLYPLKNEEEEVMGVLHVVQDVSEQLLLQQQLSERLNFIESLVESSVDRIVVLDRFMNYLYWNKKAEDYYSINKERVLGKNILEIFPSFRNDPSYQQFRTVLKGETVYLPPVADEDQYFETYLIPIKDENKDVTAVLWIVHDLSKEYQLTKERTRTANLLQATLDASKEMIQVFEAVRNEDNEIIDFKYVLLNEEAEKRMPNAVGKTLLQLQPGVVEEGIFDTFKQVVETGVPDQSERHYVHEQFNGWFFQSVVKLNDGVATTTRDITERKKAEQEILRLKDEIAQQATNKYSALFNSIDEGFSIIDLIHDDNGNLVDFIYSEINPAFIRHVGVDLRGKRRSELYFDKKDFVLEKFDHLFKTGEPLHFEHHVQALGEDQWFQVSASRIGEEGSTQLGVVFRNITERKQQEQKQQYLLQLSDALRTLSNPDEILNEALRIVAEYLNLDRIGYNEIDPAVTEYWYRACYAREGFAPVLGHFQMGPFQETVKNLQKGITFIARDAYADSFSEAEKEVHRSINVGAYVTIPLVKDGRWVCNLVAHYSKPRNWTAHEVAILEETAERIWAAVERAKAEEALGKSEEKYRTLFETMGQGYALCKMIRDANGQPIDLLYVDLNPAFERLTGLTVAMAKGKTGQEVYSGVESFWLQEYDSVIKNKQPHYVENKFEPADRWYGVFVYPAADDSVVCLFEDITERKLNEQRQSFLLQLSDALRSLSDPVEIQSAVTKLLSEYFDTARCYYMEIDEENHVATMRAETLRANVPSNIGVYDLKLFEKIIAKLRSGEALVIKNWDDSVKEEMKIGGNSKEEMTERQVVAQISVPLIKNGKLISTLTIMDNRPRNWTENDVVIMFETSERTWAAVEQAKAERAVAADLQDTQLLQKLSEYLVSEENVDVIYQQVMDAAIRLTKADAGTVQILDEHTKELMLLATSGFSEYVTKYFARVNASSNTSCGIALATNQRSFVDFDMPTEAPDVSMQMHIEAGYFSAQSTPLVSRSGKPIGMVSTHWKEKQHRPTDRELRFLDLLARQAADLIEQRQYEEALRQNKEQYSNLVTNLPDVVFRVNKELRYLYISPVIETLAGTAAKEWIGKTGREMGLPSEACDVFEQNCRECFDTGAETVMEFQFGDQYFRSRIIPEKNIEGAVETLMGITENITLRKEAEEQLKDFNLMLEQQVEEKTRITLEQTEELQKNLTLLRYTEYLAQSGSWEYEVASGNFNWSNGMYKMFGLPQQMKVRPETYLDFAVEEDRSVAKKIINNLKKKHDPFEEVMRIKRGNDIRTIKLKASVIHDDDGKAQKIIGVDFDITNVVKAEEQVKESRHWLEQTAKASPDSITVYNLQQKQPVYLNNCLSEWLNIEGDELIKMGIEGRLKLIHPDDRLKLLHNNEKIANAKDGEIVTMEYRIHTRDEKTIWLRNRSKVFQRDASGKVTHILSILQNVTEEIELREALKRRTQFAETILDASVDRITVFDRNYTFIGWNKQCTQIHGLSKEQVIGKTIPEIFPGIENYPVFLNAQERALKGEYVHVPSVRDDFTGSYLELFYVPLQNEWGETYAVLNIMHDVSNYVRTTEALDSLNKQLETKNVQLEQKNEEITSFAFVASHDMREPLRKIHTFSDWLMGQEKEHLSEKGKLMVDKINNAVHRMEVLIEDILVLTKIHSDLNKNEDVDLNKIVKMVRDDMAEKILMTEATIRVDELPIIKGNGNQVFYLFKNLMSNAIKFQKPGNTPQISITAEIVSGHEVNERSSYEEYGKISFSDNGFGFDKRYTKKIFQVFQRLHGKHEFEGTGIGLAICKKIIENHDGIITVDSEPGKGSTFSCYFPLL